MIQHRNLAIQERLKCALVERSLTLKENFSFHLARTSFPSQALLQGLFDEGHFAPECFIPECWALYSSIREACFILLFELIKRSLLLVYNLYSTIDAQVRAFYISKGSICCSFCGFFSHGILLPLPPAMFLSKSVAWTLSFILILCIINNLAFLASGSLNCIYFSL